MRAKTKLIAFDLDGVLIDGGGSWNAAHSGLGTLEASRINGEAYFQEGYPLRSGRRGMSPYGKASR